MAGMLGHGDAFVLRDPAGIRPAFYYEDDEITVIASERPVIQTAFNVPLEEIKELDPEKRLSSKKTGKFPLSRFWNHWNAKLVRLNAFIFHVEMMRRFIRNVSSWEEQ